MLRQKLAQVATAHFLLAFDQEGEVTRQLRPGLEISLNRVEMSQVLAFVVAGATRKQGPALNAWLKRGRLPKLKGLCRLHIVMPVDQEMGALRGGFPWRSRQD